VIDLEDQQKEARSRRNRNDTALRASEQREQFQRTERDDALDNIA
jgi:hypothetical protein